MKEYRVIARYNGRTVFGRVQGKNKKDAEKNLHRLRPTWNLVDLTYLNPKIGYFKPFDKNELLSSNECTC